MDYEQVARVALLRSGMNLSDSYPKARLVAALVTFGDVNSSGENFGETWGNLAKAWIQGIPFSFPEYLKEEVENAKARIDREEGR